VYATDAGQNLWNKVISWNKSFSGIRETGKNFYKTGGGELKMLQRCVIILSIRVFIFCGLMVLATTTFAECGNFQNKTPDRIWNGYRLFENRLMSSKTEGSGKTLPAYQGLSAGSVEACIGLCEGDRFCDGVTFRPPKNGRPCLKLSLTDFETGERANRFFHIYGYITAHTAVVIRRYNGSLCRE